MNSSSASRSSAAPRRTTGSPTGVVPSSVGVGTKRYWLPSENRHVRLRLSTKGIKTVDAIGVEAAVARIRARGVRI
ncbi:hypothetical protein SBADM41S_05249 [Streptomyces badius]